MRSVTIVPLLLISWIAACAAEPNEELPLRPLLYTESPGARTIAPEGFEEWLEASTDPTRWPGMPTPARARPVAATAAESPEALLEGVLRALLEHDADALEVFLFDAEGLQNAARMSVDGAAREAQAIREETLQTLRTFDPGPVSRQRPEALAGQLAIGAVTLGVPRQIDGRALREGQGDAVLHWGSEITFSLTSPLHVFTLRFPRILRDNEGTWRLQSAPQVDANWRAFRDLGLDQPARLMDTEHAPWPLSVGNFWHFQVRRPTARSDESSILSAEGYRIEVTRVDDHDRYRIVRLLRRADSPGANPSSMAWLQTPRRLYVCHRECVRNQSDLSFLLAYTRNQTPFLVLPLEPGTSWGAGGGRSGSLTWHTQHDASPADTPAGVFDAVIELSRATARGRETQSFVRGIGIVRTETVSPSESRVEELRAWRILP